jgi:protein TonB
METLNPALQYGIPSSPSRRFGGLAAMVVLHLVLGYALLSGMAQKVVAIVKKPLETKIIQEVQLPPPPPPPPPKQVRQAPPPVAPPPPTYVPPPEVAPPSQVESPVSVTTSEKPAEPAPIAPPAAAPSKPVKADIFVTCPKQVQPELPQRALEDGTGGTVKALLRIHGSHVVDVQFVSGPKLFYSAIRNAVMHYECVATGDEEVIAAQDFVFRIE